MYKNSALGFSLTINFIIISMFGFASLVIGCSSKSKKPDCPTIEQEAVSVCRAQLKCEKARNGPRFGVGLGMGVMSNVGVGVGTSTGSGDYAVCIDKDLAEQKSAANQKTNPVPTRLENKKSK